MATIRIMAKHVYVSSSVSAQLLLEPYSSFPPPCPTQLTCAFSSAANPAYNVTVPVRLGSGFTWSGSNATPSLGVTITETGGDTFLVTATATSGATVWRYIIDPTIVFCPPLGVYGLSSYDPSSFGTSGICDVEAPSPLNTGRQMFRTQPAWDGPFVTDDNTGTARCFCPVAPQSKTDPGGIISTVSGVDAIVGLVGPDPNGTRTITRADPTGTRPGDAVHPPPIPCRWYLRETGTDYDLIHDIIVAYYEILRVPPGYLPYTGSTNAALGGGSNPGLIFRAALKPNGASTGPVALDCIHPQVFANNVNGHGIASLTF